jgi:hypothetical protein
MNEGAAMNSILTKTTLSLAALTCGCLILAGSAFAQQPGGDQQQPPRGGDQQGGRGGQGGQGGDWRQRMGGGGQGGGMDWGQMMRGMGGMQPASIFATGEFLFIVRGNTLYQYDVKTLKQVNKVQLETEQPQWGGGQGGQGAQGGAPTPMPRPRPAPPADGGGQNNPPPPAP